MIFLQGDEFNILSVCTNEQWVVQRQLKWTNNPGKFQYFLLDNSVMVGLLEEQTDPTTKKQIQDGKCESNQII